MAQFEQLQSAYPNIVYYPVSSDEVKLAAAWLIDQAGWRGRDVDGVKVHQDQALVLTNPHKLSGKLILKLADKIACSVDEVFGVKLEMEPRIYP